MELFKLEEVSFRYPNYGEESFDKQPYTIDHVSFTIEKGDFVTLAGSTGCGKTTLLRLLKRELSPGGERTGLIQFCGRELTEYKEGELAAKIGFVMQSPEHQYVTDKVWHELAFGLENLGLKQEEMRSRCAEMASYFGMDQWLDKEVYTLSGGQKQLLNLASVLIMGPEILILDEPTSQLDPIAAENFIHTIKKLNEETGITILMAEHRLESVLPLSNQVLFMDQGQILYQGEPEHISRTIPCYERFKRALPCSMQLHLAFSEEENQDRCPLTVAQGKRYLEKHFSNAIARLPVIEVCAKDKAQNRTPVLEAKHLWYRYEKKGADVLRDTSLSLYPGEILCLLGANGSGKSTVLKCAAGILSPFSGKVKVDRKRIAYLPQDVETVFVTDEVQSDLKLAGFQEDTSDYPFDLSQFYHKHPYDLSGGEKQIVALAKILSKNQDILLLDEPTKGLDANAKAEVLTLLKNLRKQGKAILVVTHDVEFAALCGDNLAMFFRGEVVSHSSERSFFAKNSFYTTAASRLAKDFYEGVVTTEELLYMCEENGGKKTQ